MWHPRIAVLSGMALLISACGASGREHTVTYEVTGQETAEVAYVNTGAQLIKGQVVALPWTMTVRAPSGGYVSVLTNGAGHGTLTCVLKVDGVPVVTNDSDDVPVVRCDTTVG